MELEYPSEFRSRGGGSPESIGPGELLGRMWRGRLWIATLGLLAAGLAFGVTKRMPATYTASGLMAVEPERITIPELQSVLAGESAYEPLLSLRTEVQVLRSPQLLLAVTESLGLVHHPEFNGTPLRERVQAWIAATARSWLGDDFGLTPPARGPATPQAVADELAARLTVSNDNRSLVVGATFKARDPALAAEVMNALFREYIASRAAVRAQDNRKAHMDLTRRVEETRRKLDQLEARIEQERLRGNIVQLRSGTSGQQRLEELSSAVTRARVERGQAEAVWHQAEAQLLGQGGGPGTLASIPGAQVVALLRQTETLTAGRAAELGQRLGSNHPQTRAVQAELASVRAQIGAEARRIVTGLEAQARAARQQETELNAELEKARRDVVRTADSQASITRLEQEAAMMRGIYQTLLERQERTTPEQSDPGRIPGVRIISLAVPPERPSAPRPLLSALLALVAGSISGAAVAVARGRERPDKLAIYAIPAKFGIPNLGVVPRLAGPRGGTALSFRRTGTLDPAGVDVLRRLRSKVRYSQQLGSPRSVTFVGTAGAAVAELALNFGRVAAADGERVLLLTGFPAEPLTVPLLARPPAEPVSAPGPASWSEAVERDGKTLLDVLHWERGGSVGGMLQSSLELRAVLGEAVLRYGLIVLAAPAGAFAPGSLQLASAADAVVLVVDDRSPALEEALDAAECLTAAFPRVAMVLLTENA